MKQQFIQRSVLTGACLFLAALAPATFGQGALTPPGAPAPMMKTLQQVEPRTPIGTLPYGINSPGSYYLTTNLTLAAPVNGITVTADHVTIDLGGFVITGPGQFGGNFSAIFIPTPQVDLKVLNGTITLWSGEGVSAPMTQNSRLEDLRVNTVGRSALHIGDGSLVNNCVVQSNCFYQVGSPAIWVGNHCKVEMCIAQNNAGYGISTGNGALVADCVANHNNDGIATLDASQVIDCNASMNLGNNPGDGIFVGYGSSVSRCVASSNASIGIETISGGSVIGCTVRTNGSDGIRVQYGSTVKDCTASVNNRDGIGITLHCQAAGNTCDGNNRAGIFAYVGNNRIDNNSVTGNGASGIDCGTTPSVADLVIRNSASGNFVNYSLNLAPAPNGTQNATIFAASPNFFCPDPWANLAY